jgi:hypothetical protein
VHVRAGDTQEQRQPVPVRDWGPSLGSCCTRLLAGVPIVVHGGAEDFRDGSREQFDVRMVRGCRADVELEVVAADDVDQGEVAGPGAQKCRGRVRRFLLGDPSPAAAVPFPGGDGEERDLLGAALGAGAGLGVGEAPAGPAASLPAGGGGEVVQVKLALGRPRTPFSSGSFAAENFRIRAA